MDQQRLLNTDAVYQGNATKPEGRSFSFETPPQCNTGQFLLYIVVVGCFIGALVLFASGSIIFGVVCLVISVLLAVLLASEIRNEKKKQYWLTYTLIINTDENKFYILNESNKQRWKYVGCLLLDEVKTISTSFRKYRRGFYCTEDAYVVLQLTGNRKFTVNKQKSTTITEAENFVRRIEHFLEAQRAEKQHFLEAQIKKLRVEKGQTRKEMVNGLGVDERLRSLIRMLKCSQNMDDKEKGMTLDFWYEKEPHSIVKEYVDLLNETDDTNNIINMLMMKCQVLINVHGQQQINDDSANEGVIKVTEDK